MFPISWNKLFRKKDGSIVTIEEVIGANLPEYDSADVGKVLTVDDSGELEWSEDGSDLPEYDSGDAGKVLTVDDSGELEWSESGENYIGPAYTPTYRPIFKPSSTSGKYNTAITNLPVDFNRSGITFNPTFGATDYNIGDVYLPLKSDNFEYYKYVDSQLITDLSLVTLYNGTSGATSIELETPITNFSALIVQGCYNSGGTTSEYDTSIIYVGPEVNKPYWFGMKDRNDSYGGYLTFSDATHGSIGENNRTFKVYGVPVANRNGRKKK